MLPQFATSSRPPGHFTHDVQYGLPIGRLLDPIQFIINDLVISESSPD